MSTSLSIEFVMTAIIADVSVTTNSIQMHYRRGSTLSVGIARLQLRRAAEEVALQQGNR